MLMALATLALKNLNAIPFERYACFVGLIFAGKQRNAAMGLHVRTKELSRGPVSIPGDPGIPCEQVVSETGPAQMHAHAYTHSSHTLAHFRSH